MEKNLLLADADKRKFLEMRELIEKRTNTNLLDY